MHFPLHCQNPEEFPHKAVGPEVPFGIPGNALGIQSGLVCQDSAAEDVIVRGGEGDPGMGVISSMSFFEKQKFSQVLRDCFSGMTSYSSAAWVIR